MSEIDVIVSFQDLKETLGDKADDFIYILTVMDDIIEHPEHYSGVKALLLANKLAAYRTKIGLTGNWLKSVPSSPITRKRKDLMLSMEHNLEENINVLKLLARIEAKSLGMF